MTNIKKGDRLRICKEWQDEGVKQFLYVALEHEDGGRVRIMPLGTGLTLPPHEIVQVNMVEIVNGAERKKSIPNSLSKSVPGNGIMHRK